MTKTILIADDEQNIREIIHQYLTSAGYQVYTFRGGEELYTHFMKQGGDMIILDIMMPGRDGYEICREIRKTSEVPIIFVSARDEELDRILGLELGSDDYLSKPFSPRELVVRVKNIFRRMDKSTPSKELILSVSDLTINPKQRSIIKGSNEIPMTRKEFDLLYHLSSHPGQAFSRDLLIEEVWGFEYIGESRIIDDVIKRVRKKLKAAESTLCITTLWGFGYKIEGE